MNFDGNSRKSLCDLNLIKLLEKTKKENPIRQVSREVLIWNQDGSFCRVFEELLISIFHFAYYCREKLNSRRKVSEKKLKI